MQNSACRMKPKGIKCVYVFTKAVPNEIEYVLIAYIQIFNSIQLSIPPYLYCAKSEQQSPEHGLFLPGRDNITKPPLNKDMAA